MSNINKQINNSVELYGEVVAKIYNEKLRAAGAHAAESAGKRRRVEEEEKTGGAADKCRVSLGLNSIIDLGERGSIASQKMLFDQKDWPDLKDQFLAVCDDVDAFNSIKKKIEKIEQMVPNDFGEAKYQAAKYEYKAHNLCDGDVFTMYHQAIKVLQYHSYFFSYDHPEMTEADWMNKIWCKLMETTLRNTPEVGKVHSDRMEVLLESKLVLDDCLSRFFDDSLAVPGLYYTELTIELVSLRLVANSHYIAITEGKATFPKNTSSFKQFRNVVNLLMKFKKATQAVAHFRQNHTDYESK